MKIVFFVPQLCIGGAQQVAILLGHGFLELGHQVTIAAASLEGELIERLDERCQLADFKEKKPIKARRKLAQLVNSLCPDAVICFGIYTGIAAALSKIHWRSDTILVIRNENNLQRDWQQSSFINRKIGPLLSCWAARRAHIVAVSASLSIATADYLRIDNQRIITILNPVFVDSKAAARRKAGELHPWLSEPRDSPAFVAMGRLEYQKGFDVLIQAFQKVDHQVDARLVIFGEGPLRAALQAQIDANGLQRRVVLAGYTSDPLAQMAAASAFVLSSRYEGFGLVLVEALRARTRVISTDCDYGPREILANGLYGKLVPVGNAEILADAMLDSLTTFSGIQEPPLDWFESFGAIQAARQHISLIESLP